MSTMRLDHIHLRTTDLEAATQWYVTMLGGRVSSTSSGQSATVEVCDVRLLIAVQGADEDLLPATLQGRLGVDHFGLAVGDVEGIVEELRAKGVHIVREPFALRAGGRGAFIEAPDQVRIELLNRG